MLRVALIHWSRISKKKPLPRLLLLQWQVYLNLGRIFTLTEYRSGTEGFSLSTKYDHFTSKAILARDCLNNMVHSGQPQGSDVPPGTNRKPGAGETSSNRWLVCFNVTEWWFTQSTSKLCPQACKRIRLTLYQMDTYNKWKGLDPKLKLVRPGRMDRKRGENPFILVTNE